MKLTKLSLLAAVAILIGGAIMLGSCEGPEGPQGPAGADGTDGVDGVDGTDGTDGTDGVAGNAVCLECHTLDVKAAKTDEWALSGHGSGSTTARGSRAGCAKCHAHEGFVETAWTGEEEPVEAPVYPQVIQCKTCHDFHKSLDFENEPNSAIRQEADVTLMAYDVANTVGFDNTESNLCMHCHQARRAPFDDSEPTRRDTIPGHYGPHHSPQADFLNGYGGYEFGVIAGAAGPHESMSDCVSCHMVETAADTTGTHTFYPALESCTGCHADLTDYDYNGKVTEIEGLMDDLEALLLNGGMIDADGHVIESDDEAEPPVWISYEADSVGAMWNWILVAEDQSMGIHNPDYAIALLNASISKLSPPE